MADEIDVCAVIRENASLKAEVARLQSDNATTADAAAEIARRFVEASEECDALRTENQRLREALTTIADDCHDAARQGTYKTTDHQSAWRAVGRFARAALAGKEG